MLPPVMEIPELVNAIVSELDANADLVRMALVARRFKDISLRMAWTAPVFEGAPLVEMANLFPEVVMQRLLGSERTEFHVPPEDFTRFDYYAQFVRKLHLWHHGQEAFIARILSESRPNVWLFPLIEDLHIGASGETVETAGVYIAPTIRSLRLNHWEVEEALVVAPTPQVRSSLLQIFRLPDLESLDFLDSRFPAFEHDVEVVHALVLLAPQLKRFRSYDLTLLRNVFPALSSSRYLEDVFIDLTHLKGNYLSMQDIVRYLSVDFPSLRTLGLLSTSSDAARLLKQIDRPLHTLDLRIDSPVQAQDLQDITSCIYLDSNPLRSFRCASSSPLECGEAPPIRVGQCLDALRKSVDLQELYISFTFSGEQTLLDGEIVDFFRAWPRLERFIVESDPEDDSVPGEDEPVNFGLTLQAVVEAARYCPNLLELTLPFVDTSSIPEVQPPIPKAITPMALHLGRSHVHDRATLGAFVATLWPRANISLAGCCDFPAVEYQASDFLVVHG